METQNRWKRPFRGGRDKKISLQVWLGETTDGRPVVLPDFAFWQHALLVAPTGYGKTFVMAMILLQLALCFGMLVPDRVGTLYELMTRHFAAHQDSMPEGMRKRIQCISLADGFEFSLDPFHTLYTGTKYYKWLNAQIERVKRLIARKQGQIDYKEQNRRGRVMTVILWLSAIRDPNDASAAYVGFDRVDELLDMGTPAWDRIYSKKRSFLPKRITREIDRLRRMTPHQRNLETESTRNFFYQFFASDLIKDIVAPGKPVLDARRSIREDIILIVNLAEGEFTSPEEADAVSSLLLVFFFEAASVEKRRFIFGFEEVEKILHEDIDDFLSRARNNKVSCILVAQDLTSFQNRFADITSKAISQPDLHLTGLVRDRESLEKFAHLHGTASLPFEPNMIPMDRPDGYDVVTLPEHTDSNSEADSEDLHQSLAFRFGKNRESSAGSSSGYEFRKGAEEAESHEVTEGTRIADSDELAESLGPLEVNEREQITEGDGTVSFRNRKTIHNEPEGGRRTWKHNKTDVHDEKTGNRSSRSTGHHWKRGKDRRRSKSESRALEAKAGATRGKVKTKQTSLTQRKHLRPRYREEWYPHGLKVSEQTFYSMVMKALTRQGRGEMILRWGHRESIFLNVYKLLDPFDGREKLAAMKIRQLLEKVRLNHAFSLLPGEAEPCRSIGEPETSGSEHSSIGTPPTPSSGSEPASSTLERLLHDVQRSWRHGNGTGSSSSEESN